MLILMREQAIQCNQVSIIIQSPINNRTQMIKLLIEIKRLIQFKMGILKLFYNEQYKKLNN